MFRLENFFVFFINVKLKVLENKQNSFIDVLITF